MQNQTVHDYREHLNLMRSRLSFIPSYLRQAALREIQKSDEEYLKEYTTPLNDDDKETLKGVMNIWST